MSNFRMVVYRDVSLNAKTHEVSEPVSSEQNNLTHAKAMEQVKMCNLFLSVNRQIIIL
jgi:hypothetical protein